jgi:hypothetical protein
LHNKKIKEEFIYAEEPINYPLKGEFEFLYEWDIYPICGWKHDQV